MTKRVNYLDYLELMLIVLVIFHHAADTYDPESAWVYKPSNAAESQYAVGVWADVINSPFRPGCMLLLRGLLR